MAHPNEELLRRGYEAFSQGDLDTLRNEIFDQNMVLHVGGRNPLAGDYHGVDEVFGFFARVVELSSGTFQTQLHDTVANDEHAVGLSIASAQREGKSLEDARGAEVYHVRDGRVTEAWFMTEDPYTFDDFWS